MIKTAIEHLAEPIGFDISHSDDIVQSNLLNGLGRGFDTYRESDLCMQMCYISQKLTPEAKKWLRKLVEHNELQQTR